MLFTSQLFRNSSRSEKPGFLPNDSDVPFSGETSQPFIYGKSAFKRQIAHSTFLVQASRSLWSRIGTVGMLAQNLFTMKGSVNQTSGKNHVKNPHDSNSLPGKPNLNNAEQTLYEDPVLHRKPLSPKHRSEQNERVRSLIKEHVSHKASPDLLNKIRRIPRDVED